MATLLSISYLNLSVFALVLAPQHQPPSARFPSSSSTSKSTLKYNLNGSTPTRPSPSLSRTPSASALATAFRLGERRAFRTLYCLHTLFYINLCFCLARCSFCSARPASSELRRSKSWLGFSLSYGIVEWDAVLACRARPFCSVHWPFAACPHRARGMSSFAVRRSGDESEANAKVTERKQTALSPVRVRTRSRRDGE